MSYATLAEFKSAIGIGTADTTDDGALQSVLDATDALIDLYTDRKQGFGTASETRYYTAGDWSYVLTDDIVSVSQLQTDDNGDGTYETTWVSGTDYVLAPRNAALDGWAYTEIDTSTAAPKAFPVAVYLGVKVTGVFGWPAVPSAGCIRMACSAKRSEAGCNHPGKCCVVISHSRIRDYWLAGAGRDFAPDTRAAS